MLKRSLLPFFLLFLVACSQTGEKITVYQDPNCGCCAGWADHMRNEGFEVTEVITRNMSSVKQRFGVPHDKLSCHTAVVEKTGQIIEGHVPANAVRKLLDQPDIQGVAAPGMPMNSPGMGELDGNLITVDFAGNEFSKD